MVSSSSSSPARGTELVFGQTIFFGSLAFVADDSAWIADSPLQMQLLPSNGSVHFRADEAGTLRFQLPAQVKIACLLTTPKKKKRSGKPRSNRRCRKLATQQVAMIDSVESAQRALDELIAREGPSASLMHLFNTSEDEDVQIPDSEDQEEEGSSEFPISVAEVCMAGTPPPSAEHVTQNNEERVEAAQNVAGQGEPTQEDTRRPSVF